MKTKDEILNSYIDHVRHDLAFIKKEDAKKAMEEWGKQQAVAFHKWMGYHAIRDGENMWAIVNLPDVYRRSTTAEAYEIFLEHQQANQ